MAQTTPPRMRTILETAEITGIPVYRIRVLCKTGKISALQCGNKWLVNLDKFIEYLNAPQEAPQLVSGGVRRVRV